jgi:hypothetical protein
VKTVAGIPSMNRMLYMYARGIAFSSAIDWLHIGQASAAVENRHKRPKATRHPPQRFNTRDMRIP